MTPVMQISFAFFMVALTYAIMLAASTVAFIVVEHGSLRKGLESMGKSKRVLDEVGYNISQESLEAIRSIDILEKRVAELEAKLESKPEVAVTANAEPKPVQVQRKVEEHDEEEPEGSEEQ